jgi:cytoskeletal protein CcmA (bactofilin family)
MQFIKNKTKLKHKIYGVGVFKEKYSESAITVTFPVYGDKNLALTAFKNGLLKVIDTGEGDEKRMPSNNGTNESGNGVVQYDTSSIQIGEKNILEAHCSNKSLLFNESYTILGDTMEATSIYACYNLTVVGNLKVDKIEVKGSLTVIGNLSATEVNCQNDLLCNGKIDADSLEVGTDLIADAVKCKKFYCGGNALIKTTIDLEDARTEKVMIAGEGIIGGGKFSVQSAIAIEYFEYDGTIEGKVLELDTDTSFGRERVIEQEPEEVSFGEMISKAKEALAHEMISCGDDSEDCLLKFAKKLSEVDVANTADWFNAFSYVINISYLDKIKNFRDYLFLIYAKEILPKEMVEYETVEHIFKKPLEEAANEANEMSFTAKNIEEVMLALKIVTLYHNILSVDKDEALDKIFQSIGIKYNTVRSFFVSD